LEQIIKIELLGQEYHIRTTTDEEKVYAAAELVREKLDEYRDAARSNIKLNAAILAALDIANEYLQIREQHEEFKKSLELRSKEIIEAIEAEA
jgi:cell division protein ZapA